MGFLKPTFVHHVAFILCLGACDDAKRPDPVPEAQRPAPPPDSSAPTPKAADSGPSVDLAPQVAKAIEVAHKIEADPEHVDDVLAANQLTRDSFEALIIEISKDPELAGQYELAMATK